MAPVPALRHRAKRLLLKCNPGGPLPVTEEKYYPAGKAAARPFPDLPMKKLLFVGIHRPDRSPSQRYRFEQYQPYLESHGYSCDYSYVISAADDKVFYRPGHYLEKLGIFLKGAFHRFRDVRKASDYDIIFVQREAFMTGTTRFEQGYAHSKARLVFDFDDAIWIPQQSEANKRLSFLKDFDKTSRIIRMSDLVLAGNEYLAGYARQFSNRVQVLPTVIDTDLYNPAPPEPKPNDRVCIGWTGSFSTIEHFETALPALLEIKQKYGERVYFKLIGDPGYRNEELDVTGIPWNSKTEAEDLREIDIGIMPLPDNQWTKGKCGMKGLQYMALEIATVMSAVGVNPEIIRQGENGFLATDTRQWVDALSRLIEDPQLRRQLGREGRRTIEEKYSVRAQRDNLVRFLEEALQLPKVVQ